MANQTLRQRLEGEAGAPSLTMREALAAGWKISRVPYSLPSGARGGYWQARRSTHNGYERTDRKSVV